jgi:hypothetical protein
LKKTSDIRSLFSFTVCLFLFLGGCRGTAVFVSSSFLFKGVQKGGA